MLESKPIPLMANKFIVYVFAVVLISGLVLLSPSVGQEAVYYLAFVETLVRDFRIDFSLQGMHGQSFLILPIYLMTGQSEWSSTVVSLLAYLLNIPLIYTFTKTMYSEQTARIATYGYLMMARILVDALAGNSFSTQITFILATLILLEAKNLWSILSFALSVTIKPSSLFIFPFFNSFKRRKYWVFLASSIPIATYFVATKIQSGFFLNSLGIKSGDGIVLSPLRIIRNLAIEVYYFFSIPHLDPMAEHPFSLLASQSLVFFGLIGLFYYKKYVKSPKLTVPTIVMSFLAGAMVSFFDPLYVLPGTLMVMIIGAEFCSKHMRLLPLVFATGAIEFMNQHVIMPGVENFPGSLMIYFAILTTSIFFYEILQWLRSWSREAPASSAQIS